MTQATVRHDGVEFVLVPLEDCLGLALSLKGAGKKWHSHVLSPGCQHNPYAQEYAIVIEDDTDDVTYLARSDNFPEVDKQLVKMLHGDDILDPAKATGAGVGVAESGMLKRLVEVNKKSHHWHHHMNFPDCVFNPHRGKWAITIESDEGVFSEAYEEEPVDVLREVEVIYFANLDKKRKA
jgi:hypothetical protein